MCFPTRLRFMARLFEQLSRAGAHTRHRDEAQAAHVHFSTVPNPKQQSASAPPSFMVTTSCHCVYVDPRNTPGWYGRPHLDLLSTLNRAPTHARHTSRRQDTKLLFTAHSLPRFTATGCHVASMRLPLCLRRLCRGSLRYWEPCAFFEALVSIFSGMLLWMGFWDLIEMLLPPDAFTRLAMIAVGIIGLFGTRTMYDKSVLQSVRSRSEREERADAAMLSSMEMANYAGEGEGSNAADAGGKGGGSGSSSSSSGNGDGMSSRSVTIVGSEGFTDITPSKEACSKDRNARGSSSGGAAVSAASAGASAAEAQMTCVAPTPTALSMDATAPPCQRTHRPFFDAPRPDAKLCSRAVFAILVGLTLWVGLWDLVDYHLLPQAFPGPNNASSICESADADPGPWQLVQAPACACIRLVIFAVGVAGLWVTRSLYGTVQVHTAQFSRFR